MSYPAGAPPGDTESAAYVSEPTGTMEDDSGNTALGSLELPEAPPPDPIPPASQLEAETPIAPLEQSTPSADQGSEGNSDQTPLVIPEQSLPNNADILRTPALEISPNLPHSTVSAVQPTSVNLQVLANLTPLTSEEARIEVEENVCADEPIDRAAAEEYERSIRSYQAPYVEVPHLGEENDAEAIENLCKDHQNPGPSQLVREPISDENIFSEATTYEEEFLLTENMVNNYTFSDESKSTDSSSESVAETEITKSSDKPNLENVQLKKVEDKTNDNNSLNTETPNVEKQIEEELMASDTDQPLDDSLNEDFLLNVSDSLDAEENPEIKDTEREPDKIDVRQQPIEYEVIENITENIDKNKTGMENKSANEVDKTLQNDKKTTETEKHSTSNELKGEIKEDCKPPTTDKDTTCMDINIIPKVSIKSSESETSHVEEVENDLDNICNASTSQDIKSNENKKSDSTIQYKAKEDEATTKCEEKMEIDNEIMEEINDFIKVNGAIKDHLQVVETNALKIHSTEEHMEFDTDEKIDNTAQEKEKRKLEVTVKQIIPDDEKNENSGSKSEDLNIAGPSNLQLLVPDSESNSSDVDGLPALQDSLGLLSECRTMEREDDEDDDDDDDINDDADIQNDDDESNQMGPDSSEVESNSALNDDKEIDQSDTETTNQSEEIVVVQLEDDIDKSLESLARVIMDPESENNISLNISSVLSAVDEFGDDAGDEKEREKSPTPPKETPTSKEAEEPQTMEVDDGKPGTPDNSKTSPTKSPARTTEAIPESVSTEPTAGPSTPSKDTPSCLPPDKETDKQADTPSKTKKLEISRPSNVMNIVELEESSSDSDVQETKSMLPPSTPLKKKAPGPLSDTTTVNLPKDIDIMSNSCSGTSNIISTGQENLISGVPVASPAKKVAPRINTSEITIKTQKVTETDTITIQDEAEEPKEPAKKTDAEKKEGKKEKKDMKKEKKVGKKEKKQPRFSLEVFNVDSDEEDQKSTSKTTTSKKLSTIELLKALDVKKCINYLCSSNPSEEYIAAPSYVLSYYEVKRSKHFTPLVCRACLTGVSKRTAELMEGLRSGRDLFQLNMEKNCQELVEISDSESDSDCEEPTSDTDKLDPDTLRFLQQELAGALNDTWTRLAMSDQLMKCEEELNEQLAAVQKDCDEIDQLLAEEQKTTDRIRNDLYATFAAEVKELEPIEIYDTPYAPFMTSLTPQSESSDQSDTESRRSKRPRKTIDYSEQVDTRQLHCGLNTPAPTPPPSLVSMPASAARDSDSPVIVDVKLAPKPGDDTADVSVVKLSAESAPADLPGVGELVKTQIKVGEVMYAVRQSFVGSWAAARLLEVWHPGSAAMAGKDPSLTYVRIKFEHKLKGAAVRQLTGKDIAYTEPPIVRLTIGTRVIALFKQMKGQAKRESFYSGIIAEMPNPVNNYRYLVFFDDGYAQYVAHSGVRVVYESSQRVWEDVHADSREFVKKYLLSYPERPMVRLQPGQGLKTEWNGKWWLSRVVCVDASLVQVQFDSDARLEWIYRGSTRLAPLYLAMQAAERPRARRLNRPAAHIKGNVPYVEYTRSDEQDTSKSVELPDQTLEESRRAKEQRAVAKKSTGAPQVYPPQRPSGPKPLDDLMTRVVYYSPKSAVRPHKMVPHVCGLMCRRTDVLPLHELKTYNPLTRPLLTGWERQIARFRGKKVVMYRAPCGRRLRDMRELHRYLRAVNSPCSVDLFDFNPSTHCLAEFVLNKCYVHKKDLSHGKENVPVPCVNYYDDALPEFCLYNTERTPTSGVPLNLDPEFLCGCDCTDDCQDKTKCACWKMTLEGAKTIGLEGDDLGYHYKRLLEPLPSGIYECNSRCKCKQTCLNRVAQHPLQLKLQVFKTYNRGWGIRALNDVPKGAFLCVYAGNLLTDATANLDGINEGDEYLAELDYIEVVERMKEDYESDVEEERDENKGSKESETEEEEEEEETESSMPDEDFRPDYVGPNQQFTKSLRKRGNKDKDKEKETEKEGESGAKETTADDDQFITISDDEEVREPSRFAAPTGLDEDGYTPRHRSVRSFYGADEKCYIMDAKVQGNIGRYLNHSCSPNVFVQNVFVDTHDPRFPWVAFFALSHIQAGSELTWNYNYDIGSVPDKMMYCKCGAQNCRGRLL